MTTKRRRTVVGRSDALTHNMAGHLATGFYLFGDMGDAFEDEGHRREMWRRHRADILEGWDRAGRRPAAMWQYDLNLEPRPWPAGWSWPSGVEYEEMVHRLLLRGELAPCRLNGLVPVPDERRFIEAHWREELRHVMWLSQHAPRPNPRGLLASYAVPTELVPDHRTVRRPG